MTTSSPLTESNVDTERPLPTRLRRSRPELLAAAVLGSAVLAALSDASPTGSLIGDAFWTGLGAAAIAYAAAHAKRWTWFPLAGVAATVAQGLLAIAFGVAALLGVFVIGFFTERRRWRGAAVGGLAASALVRGHSYGFVGLPTIVAVAAVAPVVVSGYLLSPRQSRKIVKIAIAVAAVVIIPLSAYTGLTALRAEDQLLDAIDLTDDAVSALGDDDEGLAQSLLDSSAREFDSVATQFDRPWIVPARFIPVVGQHASAVHRLAASGADATANAAAALSKLDADSLQAEPGRIDVVALDELVASLSGLFTSIDRAQTEVADIDRTWLIPTATRRIDIVEEKLTSRFGDVSDAAAAVEVIPNLLGADGERNYLVLFITPAESRGLGGFAGNWAELNVDAGALTLAESGRGDEINDALPEGGIELPTELLDLYDGWRLPTKFQNVTAVPDFPTAAGLAADQYEAATGRIVDGVLTIDPAAMAGLVSLSGSVTIDDRTLSAADVERFVLRDQYIDYEGDEEGRLTALDALTDTVFNQFITGDLPAPGRLVDVLAPLAEQDHIRMTTFDLDEQAALETVGLNDAFPAPAGQDLLAVISQNSGENKIDLFLDRSIAYTAVIDPDTGDVTAQLDIELVNRAPTDGLPDAIIGNNDQEFPIGTNRLQLSVYSPLDLQGALVAGLETELEVESELGWNRYQITLFIDAGETEHVTLDLAGQIDVSEGYVLTVERQPTANPDQLTLDFSTTDGSGFPQTSGVDAQGGASFTLDSDRLIGLIFQ